jgi:hypothetical protein
VIPVQDGRDAPFAYDRAAYAEDSYGDTPSVRVGAPALLHDLRVAPISYDPAYHPTETGVGMIDFQYRVFNNVDTVDGFGTIGIEKPDNADALLYSYFNQYTPGSAAITSGRAIRFVPTREQLAGLADPGGVPALSLVAPNPICPGGRLLFSLGRGGNAGLKVYDVSGRLVRTLLEAALPAGLHQARWDGCDDFGRPLPSGTYFYHLEGGDRRSIARKGILVR